MNPACLPRGWLDDPGAAADPWRLVSDDPRWPHHRDAALGDPGHPRLQQLLNVALFALYSSVRADEATGHHPCGLSHDGWDGTVFWDTEPWTLPTYALFRPDLALAAAGPVARPASLSLLGEKIT